MEKRITTKVEKLRKQVETFHRSENSHRSENFSTEQNGHCALPVMLTHSCSPVIYTYTFREHEHEDVPL